VGGAPFAVVNMGKGMDGERKVWAFTNGKDREKMGENMS